MDLPCCYEMEWLGCCEGSPHEGLAPELLLSIADDFVLREKAPALMREAGL